MTSSQELQELAEAILLEVPQAEEQEASLSEAASLDAPERPNVSAFSDRRFEFPLEEAPDQDITEVRPISQRPEALPSPSEPPGLGTTRDVPSGRPPPPARRAPVVAVTPSDPEQGAIAQATTGPIGLELFPVAVSEATIESVVANELSPSYPPIIDGDAEPIPESLDAISEDSRPSEKKRPPPPRRNSLPSAPSDSHIAAATAASALAREQELAKETPAQDATTEEAMASAPSSPMELAPRQPPPAPSRVPRESAQKPAVPERAKPSAPSTPAAAPVVAGAGTATATATSAPTAEVSEKPKARPRRPWWEELFGEDFSRATARLVEPQIDQEATFIEESLGVAPGAALLDLGCGAGYHAVELASRGYAIVGYDLSLHQLALAQEVAQERGQKLNFLQGDMREMAFEEVFDGMYCWNTTFGYFEEEKNVVVAERMFAALKPGGTLLLDVANRDFVAMNQPSSVWYEGDSCVCMDDMSVDFFTSRLRVKRSLILDDGRTRECHYSIRLYSLHELGRILHDIGFRVTEA
ncbi:MAG TPA: methyltransferase domain-containing protein, partial [Polyangiaceae bacterium]